MERTPTSPDYAYAPEFASRVGAILIRLLVLIARRLAGHPLLAPLTQQFIAAAQDLERLLADLAAQPPPRPRPCRVGRPSRPTNATLRP